MKFSYGIVAELCNSLRFLVATYYYLCNMINELKFIANDFSINCYGFKVDTAGIDLSRHTNTNTTPAFYNHDRSEMPLGVWRGLSKKDGKLVATGLELDMEDDEAIEMARKIELGHLNSVSMGLIVNEFKQIGNDIVAVKSELLELSIVDVPANKNAIRLYEMNAEGNLVHLSIPDFESKKLESLTIDVDKFSNEAIIVQRLTEEQKNALSSELEKKLTATNPYYIPQINRNNEMENVTKEQFENLSMRMDAQENELKALKIENVSLKADLTAEKDSKVTVKDILTSLNQREMAHPKTASTLLERVEAYKNLTFMQIYKKKEEKGDEFLQDLKAQYPEEHAKIMSRK